MLELIEKAFPKRPPEWKEKLKEMVPSNGTDLAAEPDTYHQLRTHADNTLGLNP